MHGSRSMSAAASFDDRQRGDGLPPHRMHRSSGLHETSMCPVCVRACCFPWHRRTGRAAPDRANVGEGLRSRLLQPFFIPKSLRPHHGRPAGNLTVRHGFAKRRLTGQSVRPARALRNARKALLSRATLASRDNRRTARMTQTCRGGHRVNPPPQDRGFDQARPGRRHPASLRTTAVSAHCFVRTGVPSAAALRCPPSSERTEKLMTSYAPVPARTGPAVPVDRIPVSLLTGFLGAGKTTLLNKLMKHPAMAGTAVLINEFGEVGIDHHLVERLDDTMILLDSGCLCCSVQGDLIAALKQLHLRSSKREIPPITRVVIETTGLADPVPVIYTLMEERFVAARFVCDSVLTVVDATHGLSQIDHHPEALRQIAMADRLLITKGDLAGPATRPALDARLDTLNPGALRLDVRHGQIEPDLLFGSGIYSTSRQAAGRRSVAGRGADTRRKRPGSAGECPAALDKAASAGARCGAASRRGGVELRRPLRCPRPLARFFGGHGTHPRKLRATSAARERPDERRRRRSSAGDPVRSGRGLPAIAPARLADRRSLRRPAGAPRVHHARHQGRGAGAHPHAAGPSAVECGGGTRHRIQTLHEHALLAFAADARRVARRRAGGWLGGPGEALFRSTCCRSGRRQLSSR
jgi:G3E family GTPase